jgi:ribosomal protein S14
LKKRKISTIKKKLDKLWSEKIRQKGRCEICGRKENLNSHHIIGRRSLNLRWDIRNGCCLCPACHTFSTNSAHQNPLFFLDWLKKHRPDDLKYLKKKQYETPKPLKINDLLELEKQL